MKRLLALASGLALCAATVTTGCGSDDDDGGSPSGGSGGTAATGGTAGSAGTTTGGAGGTAGTGGADAGTITASGVIREFVANGTGQPLADVQVCLKDATTPPCVQTDASGAYTMAGIPANSEGVLLLTKTGYVNVALVGTTADIDLVVNGVLPTTATGQLFATAAGFAWPMAGNSIIGFGVGNEAPADAGALDAGTDGGGVVAVSGAKCSITPAAGKGPVYIAATGLPDLAATTTSDNGGGFFGDVPPGEYTLTVTAPTGMTCQRAPGQGWAAASTDSIKVPAVADYVVSAVLFACK